MGKRSRAADSPAISLSGSRRSLKKKTWGVTPNPKRATSRGHSRPMRRPWGVTSVTGARTRKSSWTLISSACLGAAGGDAAVACLVLFAVALALDSRL